MPQSVEGARQESDRAREGYPQLGIQVWIAREGVQSEMKNDPMIAVFFPAIAFRSSPHLWVGVAWSNPKKLGATPTR